MQVIYTRQITGNFTITLSGTFLTMLLIYKAEAKKCHLKLSFSEGFNLTHTSNYWPMKKGKGYTRKPYVKVSKIGIPTKFKKKLIMVRKHTQSK